MKTSKGWLKICLLMFAVSLLFVTGCNCKKKPIAAQPTTTRPEAVTPGEGSERMTQERMREEAAKQKFVNEDVHFDFDSSAIRPDAKEILQEKVKYLKDHPGVSVTLEGNCDERGTEAYNLALGERRAQSVKKFLVNAGIEASRLNTVSYGKEKPLDPAHNAAAWAKNRRVHFRVD